MEVRRDHQEAEVLVRPAGAEAVRRPEALVYLAAQGRVHDMCPSRLFGHLL